MAADGTAVVEALVDPYRRREYVWRRWSALQKDRATWDPHARQLARHLLPRASRFTTSDTNQGGDRHHQIYDNTALKSVRTLGAGLMSGMTSPARPWFRLKHPDDELMAFEPVKVWCAEATRRMLDVFARSNIYRALHQTYIELGVFGTHATLLMPDDVAVIHATPQTWGEYCLATDQMARVDTIYRQFSSTAVNLVREFGYEQCSTQVQAAYRRGHLDERFDVVHAIEPRLDRDVSKLDQRNMAWRSCYFEEGAPKDKYLRESGFRRFRALCPRWQVTGLDVYGESPGMEALGDTRQLQHEQFRKAQGIDYQTKPPVGLPSAMKGQETDLLPGGVTYFDNATVGNGQRQLFDVKLDLNHLLADIIDIRSRIQSAFYADLFLMMANMDTTGQKMTATEVAERHEEKLLMLGPVLERLHNELLDPLVDMTFELMLGQGLLPPPPPELEGQELDVELISMLAQAQRAITTNSMDRFLIGVGGVAQLGKPEVADKIDGDAFVEAYGDALGVDPRVLADDAQVERVRAQRAQAQQAAQAEAAAQAQAERASKLGGVSTQGGTSNMAADAAQAYDVIGQYSGYQNPQAERLP